MQTFMRRLLKKRDQKGFTLIELLVVVAIIGTLMAVGISNYISYRTQGVNAAAQAAATDFLTLALADVASTGVAGAYDGTAGSPPGFDPPPPAEVAIVNSAFAVSAAGVVSGSITFTGTGGTTYTVDNTGVN